MPLHAFFGNQASFPLQFHHKHVTADHHVAQEQQWRVTHQDGWLRLVNQSPPTRLPRNSLLSPKALRQEAIAFFGQSSPWWLLIGYEWTLKFRMWMLHNQTSIHHFQIDCSVSSTQLQTNESMMETIGSQMFLRIKTTFAINPVAACHQWECRFLS